MKNVAYVLDQLFVMVWQPSALLLVGVNKVCECVRPEWRY